MCLYKKALNSPYHSQFNLIVTLHMTNMYGSFHTKLTKKVLTLPDFNGIWHRYGVYLKTLSHQVLAYFIDYPLRYDHTNFIETFSLACILLPK